MRKRLLLSYLSVVFVVLVVLEIPLAILANHHERSSLMNQATSTALSIAVLAGADLGAHQFDSLQTLVQRYHLQAGGELLVVNGTGQVVASSNPDGPQEVTDVHPLVTAALQGRNATGWRTNDGGEAAVAAVPVHVGASTSTVDGVVVLYLPADSTVDRIHEVWLALGIFAAAVLALTALVGSGLARGVTRPLAALSTAVKRLGSGNLSERAEPGGPAELQALAVEFNRMAARIEELVTAQTRFVADASHQLRSPLTALRLRLENLEMDLEPAAGGADARGAGVGAATRDGESTSGAAASVAAASQEVQRLSRLVDGLLTLTRAERNRAQPQPVRVTDVVAGRLETWKPLADEKGVRLDSGGAPDGDEVIPLVPGDLEQILDNLLSNALDATPAGGGISVEVVPTAAGVDVSVVDDGPGMTSDERARAFDRFWQGAGHRGGSSGLGLAIVAQLAQHNDATVELLPAGGETADGEAGGDGQPAPGVTAGGASGPDTGGVPSTRVPNGTTSAPGTPGGRSWREPPREMSRRAGAATLTTSRAGRAGLRATIHLSRRTPSREKSS